MTDGTAEANVRPTILLVEDEPLVRQMIALELEDAGYDVVEAADGRAAIAILEDAVRVDLVFTDIRMPGGLDGWQLAERARAMRAGIPVIYATGFTDDSPRPVPGGILFKKPYKAAAIIEAMERFGVSPHNQPTS